MDTGGVLDVSSTKTNRALFFINASKQLCSYITSYPVYVNDVPLRYNRFASLYSFVAPGSSNTPVSELVHILSDNTDISMNYLGNYYTIFLISVPSSTTLVPQDSIILTTEQIVRNAFDSYQLSRYIHSISITTGQVPS